MTRFNIKHAALILCASLASCAGLSDEELPTLNIGGGGNSGGDEPEATSEYLLSVDQSEIESDGADAALFIIKDKKGNVVSTAENIKKCYYYYKEDDKMLPARTTSFTSIMDGTYEFYAKFDGHKTGNTVTVTSKNRSAYEKFFRKVGVFQLTGTWCSNCPSMTGALEKVPYPAKDHMVWLAFHGDQGDPFRVPVGNSDQATVLGSMMGASGYPSTVYNLNKVDGGTRTGGGIADIISAQLFDYPSTTGVRIVESKIDNKQITIRAAIKADKGGDYNLGYAVLLDGQSAPNGYEPVYNRIVVAAQNYNKYNAADRITLKAGQEVEKEFVIEGNLLSKKDKMTVCVFSVRKEPGSVKSQSLVDNIEECKLGQSTEYHYN